MHFILVTNRDDLRLESDQFGFLGVDAYTYGALNVLTSFHLNICTRYLDIISVQEQQEFHYLIFKGENTGNNS